MVRDVDETIHPLGSNLVIADSVFVRLAVNDVVVRAPGAILDAYTYSQNGAFDPNVTGGGIQPAGFDQYSGFYGYYQVLASSISVQIINNTASTSMVACLYPSNVATTLSYTNSVSLPYSRRSAIGALGSVNIKSIVNYITTKKLVGREVSSVNYAAPVTAQPAAQTYWQLSARAADGATNLSYTIQTHIVYTIKFYYRLPVVDI